MKHESGVISGATPLGARHVFSPYACDVFAACYPETPHKLRHNLTQHPLLELDALAELAESLPADSVDFNRGNAPIELTGKPGDSSQSIGETIRAIAHSNGWAVLRNVGQDSAYGELLAALIGELEPDIRRSTGAMSTLEGCIFVSNLKTVTPNHSDPRHLLLMQLTGSKELTQFPLDDTPPNEPMPSGSVWNLQPGDAVFVPVMVPHRIKGGAEPAVTLSLTWRSKWSQAEADARAFNALLRRRGFNPGPTRRWPESNAAKAFLWKLCRNFA